MALTEEVSARLKAKDLAGATVTLKLKTADFQIRTRARSFDSPTQLGDEDFRGRQASCCAAKPTERDFACLASASAPLPRPSRPTRPISSMGARRGGTRRRPASARASAMKP